MDKEYNIKDILYSLVWINNYLSCQFQFAVKTQNFVSTDCRILEAVFDSRIMSYLPMPPLGNLDQPCTVRVRAQSYDRGGGCQQSDQNHNTHQVGSSINLTLESLFCNNKDCQRYNWFLYRNNSSLYQLTILAINE